MPGNVLNGWALSREKALIEASPKGYTEKGAFKLATVDGPSWSHPVIHNGRLYLRDQNTLMCYDLRSN